MSWSMLPWALLKCVGLLSIYAAVAPYETEEGLIQNRVEAWWVRVTDARNTALSRIAAFMRESARSMLRAFDGIYGVRLVSLRLVCVSIYFSLASLNLSSLLSANGHSISIKRPFPFGSFLAVCYFLLLGLVPAVATGFRWYRWIMALWYLPFVIVFVQLAPFAVFLNQKNHALAIAMLILIMTALGISFVCDVLYIALMRRLLRGIARSSVDSHVYGGVLAIFVCVLLILLLFPAPMLLGAVLVGHYHLRPDSLAGYAAGAAMFSFVLNSVSLLTCLLGLVFACVVLLHRFFWPLLQRPLYAFQRFGVIKQKPLLWAVGIALLLLTPPPWSWRVVLEALSKL